MIIAALAAVVIVGSTTSSGTWVQSANPVVSGLGESHRVDIDVLANQDPTYLNGLCAGLRAGAHIAHEAQIETGNSYDPRGWPIRLLNDMRLQDAQIDMKFEGAHGPLYCPAHGAPRAQP